MKKGICPLCKKPKKGRSGRACYTCRRKQPYHTHTIEKGGFKKFFQRLGLIK